MRSLATARKVKQMVTSIKRRIAHLQSEVVGSMGRVSVVAAGRSTQRFVVHCRACRVPDPYKVAGIPGLRRELVAEATYAREVGMRWLEHEATPSHQLNVDRATSSEPFRPVREPVEVMDQAAFDALVAAKVAQIQDPD